MALSDVTAALAYGNEQYAQGYAQGKTDQAGVDQQIIDQAHADLASVQQALVAETAKYDALAAATSPPPPPPPPPPPTKVVLGVSVDVALPDPSQVPGAVRFYQTTLSSKVTAVLDKGTRVIVWSTKDATPTAFKAAIGAAQKKYPGLVVYATANHEPDDDITKDHTMTVAQYVAKLNAFGTALKGMSGVHFGPIHNGWMGHVTWLADEFGADTSLWTYWGMDRYSDKYETPETVFAEGRDYAKSLGLPLVVGECGGSPSNPTAQQILAGQIRTWGLNPANNAAVVCWWVGTGYAFANAAVQHALYG